MFMACNAVPPDPESPVDNERLATLFEEDQKARKMAWDEIDWATVNEEDEDRREEVLALLNAGRVKTAKDFYNAAMVFQHGASADDIRLAFSLAWISATMDPKATSSRWLTAAAWDRIMMHEGVPQWYGTQFTKSKPEAPWELYEVDETVVDDEERIRMGVPTLKEARERAEGMNRK